MATRKTIKKKLLQKLAGASLAQLDLLREAVDEVCEMRKPEIKAREAVGEVTKEKGIKLKEATVGDIQITFVESTQSAADLRKEKYFWVADDTLIPIARMSKVRELRKTGANIIGYSKLPPELKDLADKMLSVNS